MFKKCRNILRNEKGLTLIELLAVVVILGIIAAIAIPSIGSIIAKSKNDAIVADGQQVMNAARLALLSEDSLPGEDGEILHSELDDYLDKLDTSKWVSITVTVDENRKVTGARIVVNADKTITLDENGKE